MGSFGCRTIIEVAGESPVEREGTVYREDPSNSGVSS